MVKIIRVYVNKKEYYLREIGEIRDRKVKIVDE